MGDKLTGVAWVNLTTTKRLSNYLEIRKKVKQIQVDVREHKACGELFVEGGIAPSSLSAKIARKGAYTAKYFAEIM